MSKENNAKDNNNNLSRSDRIKAKLSFLKPTHLVVMDNSVAHESHFSSDHDETHLTIEIASELFKNRSRVQQHKMITKLISEEFDSGLHALNIKILDK